MFTRPVLTAVVRATAVLVVLGTMGLFLLSVMFGDAVSIPGVIAVDSVDTGERFETTFDVSVGGLITLTGLCFAFSLVAAGGATKLASRMRQAAQ